MRLGNSAEIEQLVSDRKLDLGFVGGRVKNPTLYVEPYFRDELVMIVSPEHPLKNKKDFPVKDLEKETLIWRGKGSATRTLIEQFLNDNDIIFKKKVEIGDTEAIKRLVAAKMGIAFVSKHAVTLELSTDILQVVDSNNLLIPMNYYIISAKDQHYYPTVLAFLNFIRKWSPEGWY